MKRIAFALLSVGLAAGVLAADAKKKKPAPAPVVRMNEEEARMDAEDAARRWKEMFGKQ